MSEASTAPPPAEARTRPQRASRQRGEATRRRLLDATLRVIARDGVRAVSHRGVAREAGVALSLTTYYFVDLCELIATAFTGFFQAGKPELDAAWQAGFAIMDACAPDQRVAVAGRRRMCDQIAARISHYVLRKIVEQPTWLAVEHHFFFEALVDPRLTALAREHRRQLVEPMVELARRLGSDEPEIDGDLLFGTLTRLEYEALVVPPEQVDAERIRREVRRLVGWIAGA